MNRARRARAGGRWGWALAIVLSARASVGQDTMAVSLGSKLYDEGKKAFEAGNFVEACPKLKQSAELTQGYAAFLSLGLCYEKIDRPASAHAAFQRALGKASTNERREAAEKGLSRVVGKIPKIKLKVSDEASKVPGLNIALDEVSVPRDLWGAELPVDPGEHALLATAADHEPAKLSFKVEPPGPSGAQAVEVPLLKPAPRPVPPDARPGATTSATAPPPPPPSSPLPPALPPPPQAEPPSPVPGYVVGGLGVALLGVGTVFGLRALSQSSDFKSACPSSPCSEEGQRKWDDANRSATVANVTVAIGLAGVAVGGILLYRSSSATSSGSASRRVELGGVGGGFGLRIGGALLCGNNFLSSPSRSRTPSP